MGVLTFRGKPSRPGETTDAFWSETLAFDALYPEALQLNVTEKRELLEANGICTWLYIDGQLVGETYGLPLEYLPDDEVGLPGLEQFRGTWAVYCHSNTILPEWQGKGYGRVLKAYWLGLLRGMGYTYVIGHARPGPSVALNQGFDATFGQPLSDWYGPGEAYSPYWLLL